MNKYPKVNYIGNKEKIAEWICNHFPEDTTSVFDAFSGGASVAYLAKAKNLKVVANDVLKINYLISKVLVENSTHVLTDEDLEIIFSGKPFEGFMYKNYAEKYFFDHECTELDLYRKNIEGLSSEYKKALALILLRRAMIRKMPYSRFNLSWDKIKQLRDEEYSYEKYKRRRGYHNESFKAHFNANLEAYNRSVFDNGKNNLALNLDIFEAIDIVETDLIYIDPPYTGTMNNYHEFYGLLDSYIDGKVSTPFKNNFIKKEETLKLFDQLFSSLGSFKYWALSYNNSSYPNKKDLIDIIKKYRTDVQVFEKDHSYKLTGKQNKSENREYLFLIK